jgi:K+-transporting ATPase ATPase C chain
MLVQLRTAVIVFVALTVLTGLVYPALVTLAGQVFFANAANGSLIVRNQQVVGSEWIGQPFTDPKYFWSRPSATSPAYNGGSSSGSNLGPTNSDYLKTIAERVAAMRAAHPDQTGDVPVDLVTASASGLDPHISPAAAFYQVARVAAARQLSVAEVEKLVKAHCEDRTWGLFGEPRVNVLKLNLALDAYSHER